jgi:hypothetical protein
MKRSEEYNKQYHLTKAKEARQRKLAHVNALKSEPCTDCGGTFHYSAMDFDHVGSDKVADIAWLINNRSWNAVLEEIKKCELVCSNCHRVRTWTRLQHAVVA